jgi:2-C-methyl-D-erythritol 2,4-cyclodiphosphate synthase
MIKVGIGQDSHRIFEPAEGKPLMLGGLQVTAPFALEGNSDADVVLHAVTNAISGITGQPIIGPVADRMCKAGILDSASYLDEALKDLRPIGYAVSHVSVSIECLRPKILPILDELRACLADLLGLKLPDVGITATTGEGLTDFGKGLGIQAFAIVTAVKLSEN